MGDLYETDLVLWASEQARALRAHDHARIEYDRLAEEIESLAKIDRRSLGSYIAVVLQHLIKLQASPASDPRRGWLDSIVTARAEIQKLLQDSPSLRQDVAELIQAETPQARGIAAKSMRLYRETPKIELDRLTYDEEQVLGDWFPPEDPA